MRRDHLDARWRAGAVAALVLLSPIFVWAGRGGPDAGGYRWIDSDEPEVVILAGAPVPPTVVQVSDETVSATIPLPFLFYFYGAWYSEIQVCDNGWIGFSPPSQSNPAPATGPIPDAAAAPDRFIAPFWRDFLQGGPGTAQFVYGNDINREAFFIRGSAPVGSPQPVSFWVDLFPDGQIHIQWELIDPAMMDATLSVGIENEGGTAGTQLMSGGVPAPGFNLRAPYAVRFFPPAPPPSGLDCTVAEPIACGQSITSASASGLQQNAWAYGCAPGTYYGSEKIFELTVPQTSMVSLQISNFAARDLDLLFLDACDEALACIAGGADQLVLPYVPAGQYYVVVDGRVLGDDGAFDLTVDCQQTVARIDCTTGPVIGDTSPFTPGAAGYSCVPGRDLSGPEEYYLINLPAPGTLAAWLDNTAADLDILIADPVGFVPSSPGCLAWGDNQAIAGNLLAGDQLIVVDGLAGASGGYTLSVACGPMLDCTAATAMDCFQTVAGDTAGSINRAMIYSLADVPYDGPEDAYTFINPATDDVFFLLEGAPAEMDLLLLDGCDESRVLQIADSMIVMQALAPGQYTVVVDGRAGVSGQYTLKSFCGARMNPSVLDAQLNPGECIEEQKEVLLPGWIPAADIVFIMDTTGSMRDEIDLLTASVDTIALQLLDQITNPAFGLISHRDYPDLYNTCGYFGRYGAANDYPYRVEAPIDTDITALRTALAGLQAASGEDGPESYARALFETYSDPALGLRNGAHRIAISFGDNIPHDCDLYSCIGQPGTSTGLDPGRDAIAPSADDLAILDVINGLGENCFTLLHLYSGNSQLTPQHLPAWDCWAGMLGGFAYQINEDGSIPGDVSLPDIIQEYVAEDISFCDSLTLAATPPYESWVTQLTPPFISNLPLPNQVTFDIRICVPAGTSPGNYSFQVQALCDLAGCGSGIVMAEQDVNIVVPGPCSALADGGDDVTVCLGEEVALDGGASAASPCAGGLEYHWLAGATEVCPWSAVATCPVSPSGSTTYTLEVRCAGDPECTASDTVLVSVVEPPGAAAGEDREICEEEPLELNASASTDPGCPGGLEFRWMEGAVERCPWSPSPVCSFVPPATATYTLETRCAGLQSCLSSDDTTVVVKDCSTAVSFGSFGVRDLSAGRREVYWTTVAEAGTLGFVVMASDSGEDPERAVSLGYVPAKGAASPYSLAVARDVASGNRYQIIEVTAEGLGDKTPWFHAAGRSLERGRGARTMEYRRKQPVRR